MYYRFLDSDSRDTLDLVMDKSVNFREFVVSLGKHVDSAEVSLSLAHIAAVFAWELREVETIERIAGCSFGSEPVVRPWTFPFRTRSDRISTAHLIDDAVEFSLSTNPEEWIKAELLLLKSYVLLETPQGSLALEDVKQLVASNPDLSCFNSYIHHIDARIRYSEGNLANALPICETGLDLATKTGNLYQAVWLHRWLGMMTMNTEPKLAIAQFEQAYQIAKGLGSQFHTEAVLTEMGWVSIILGEYDLAIAFYDEARQLASSQDSLSDRHSLVLSNVCSDLGDGPQALDWAEWALEWHLIHGSEGDSWTHLALARALILLDRLEEASKHLDAAREMAFRSGQEREIAFYYLVSGLYETASGNPRESINILQNALEICERTNTQMYLNRCVFALACAEMELFKLEGGDETNDSTGHWMEYLEELAHSRNLPGLLIQHSLLKAELQKYQNRYEDARSTLIDALTIYDSPGVKSLQNQVLEKIREIDTRL